MLVVEEEVVVVFMEERQHLPEMLMLLGAQNVVRRVVLVGEKMLWVRPSES